MVSAPAARVCSKWFAAGRPFPKGVCQISTAAKMAFAYNQNLEVNGLESLTSHADLANLSTSLPRSAEAASTSRFAVEAYFVTNALSFFAGWAWIVFLRDLSALVGQQAVLRESQRSSVLGLTSLDRAEVSSFGGQLGSLLLFGPMLSLLVYRARRCCVGHTEVQARDAVDLLPRNLAVALRHSNGSHSQDPVSHDHANDSE